MKREWFIYLLVILLGITLNACKGDNKEPEKPEEPKVLATLPDKDGFVVLAGGEYVEATTNFSDEEALVVLQSKRWCPYVETYFYNEKQEIGFNDKLHDEYFDVSFKNDGTFEELRFNTMRSDTIGRRFQYSVENRVLKTTDFSRSMWYFPAFDLNVSFNIISVDKDRIIVDVPCSKLIIGGNRPIELIDYETAMVPRSRLLRSAFLPGHPKIDTI